MKIVIHVEGHSDRTALEACMAGVIEAAQKKGIGIKFIPLGSKDKVLEESPAKAVGHLQDNSEDQIIALPDLYPMKPYVGTSNEHKSSDELISLLRRRFLDCAKECGLSNNFHDRYAAFCLKHDLECLLLASPDALRARLGTGDKLTGNWRRPVEDQNDSKPPKYVVHDLFEKYKRRNYLQTTDAPWILQHASVTLDALKSACSQCFRPFVQHIEKIVG